MANPKIEVEIGAKVSALQKALSISEEKLQSFGRSATQLGKVLSIGVTTPLLALAAASIKTFGEIEALKKGLIAVTGSAEDAETEFKKLIEVAKLPGLGLEEAVRGSVALQSAGFSADQAREALLAFGNALATVGKGKTELNFVTLALTQLQNKTTGFGQDLRQLVEQLPQLRGALTAAFGTAESEEIAKLGVTGKQVVETLVTEFAKLPKVSGGIKNAFENVSDSIQISFATIGESINKILGVESLIDKVGERIRSLAEGFANLSPLSQKLILGFAALAAAIGPISLAIGGIIQALPLLAAGFAALTGPIGLISAAVIGLGILIATNFDQILFDIKVLALGFIDTSINIIKALNTISSSIPGFTAVTTGAIGALQVFGKEIAESLISNLGEKTTEAVGGLKDSLDSLDSKINKSTLSFEDFSKAQDEVNKKFFIEGKAAFDAYNSSLEETLRLQSQIESVSTQISQKPVVNESSGVFEFGNLAGDKPPITEFADSLEEKKENIISATNQISAVFVNLGSTIGDALSGGASSFANFGNALLKTVGAIAVQLGEAAIGIGVAMLAIKLAFTNPFTAIAAGIALIALGSALGNIANNAISGGGGGGGSVGSSVSGST
ncbi:MAG TPA: tape measure protein, partial [Vampirovibrionales bacterium]